MTPEEQQAYDAVVAERDQAREQVTGITGERDAARGDLRSFKHRTEFRTVALAKGVNPKALDLFYRDSGYDDSADEPDPAAIAELIDAQREPLDFLFKPASAPATENNPAPPKPEPKPAPAGSSARGGAPPRPPGKFKVTAEQLADCGWMMKNAAAFAKASADGTLELPTF